MSYTFFVAHGLSFVVFCRFAKDGCALIVSIAGAFRNGTLPPLKKTNKQKTKKRKCHNHIIVILTCLLVFFIRHSTDFCGVVAYKNRRNIKENLVGRGTIAICLDGVCFFGFKNAHFYNHCNEMTHQSCVFLIQNLLINRQIKSSTLTVFNNVVVDALAPCVARPSIATELNMKDKGPFK